MRTTLTFHRDFQMEDGLDQQYDGIYCEDHNENEPVHSDPNVNRDKNNRSSNGGSGGAQSVVNEDEIVPYYQNGSRDKNNRSSN